MSLRSFSKFEIDMTAAGSQTIGTQGSFLVIQDMRNGGALDLSGYIRVRPESQTEHDFITMSLNHSIEGAFDRVELQWDAQPGVVASVVITEGDKMRIGAPPARQLVTSAVATGLDQAVVAVDDAGALLAAADGARQSVTIFNLAGDTIYIGNASVTDADGMPVAEGQGFVVDKTTAAVYAVCATGESASVRVLVEA